MKITKGKTRPPHEEGYQLIIHTMEGDADDFHSIDYDYNVDQTDKLREMIIV